MSLFILRPRHGTISTWVAELSCQTGQNVSSDSPTFHPANIYAKPTNVSEGQNVTIKCSLLGVTSSTPHKDINMYLCKDGIGVCMELLSSKKDATFIFPDVTQQDSGSYSCVYSDRKVNAGEVRATGANTVFIQVHQIQVHSQPESAPWPLFKFILFLIAGLLAWVSSLGMCYICCRISRRKRPKERPPVRSPSSDDVFGVYCEIECVPPNTEPNSELIDSSALYSTSYREHRQAQAELNDVYAKVTKSHR
ncbi:uncharacterized protein LOC121694892 isoform X2 [Alosa sapidissima]|uniref:uncharacterized protein LOC121694892 isoform X2 n=1 Tax=Alosa sapidissima TaxID=34773 RepID=UPI001C098C81|nr:uncharacterized protein LOC121694892 isoform X2 [Alosa sapidissima]